MRFLSCGWSGFSVFFLIHSCLFIPVFMDWQAACSDEFKMACHRHHCGNQTCVKCTKDIDLPPRMCYSYSLQNRACQTDKECLGFESCLIRRTRIANGTLVTIRGLCVETSPSIPLNRLSRPYPRHNQHSKTANALFGGVAAKKIGTVESTCISRKYIIIDVQNERSGFGNRMVSLVSAVQLAVLLDRVLFLKWNANDMCGARYEELFDVSVYEKRGDKRLFVYGDEAEFSHFRYSSTVSTCRVDLTVSSSWLYAFTDKELFKKMDSVCTAIYITANQYFGNFFELLGGPYKDKLDAVLTTHSYQYLCRCLFQYKPSILDGANSELQKIKKSGPFLSLHIRGYFSSGKEIMTAFECVNKMLDEGVVNRVFVATDMQKAFDFAKSQIVNEKYMIYLDKELEQHQLHYENRDGGHTQDSLRIRQHMEDALKEHYIIGKADYCGATDYSASTFSQTAIAAGTCSFVDVTGGDKCQFKAETGMIVRGRKLPKGMHTSNTALDGVSETEERRVLNLLHRNSTETHLLPFVPGNLCSKRSAVREFWSSSSSKCDPLSA